MCGLAIHCVLAVKTKAENSIGGRWNDDMTRVWYECERTSKLNKESIFRFTISLQMKTENNRVRKYEILDISSKHHIIVSILIFNSPCEMK